MDPAARFGFIDGDGHKVPRGALTFDTFGGDFTHEGDECTFEVLARRFSIDDPGVRALAEIVHDCDLEDGKFERAEVPVVLALVRGLVATIADDDALLAVARPVFEALRQAYAHPAHPETPKTAKKKRRR